jgi:tetratricopeptide (TPR) repeat protein
MGFDKAKVLRAAEKYLAQGKIPAAIAEYRQIVENDADDFMALNVLGDLYSRANQTGEAVACFKSIAEHYREQGFILKAVAMYKKIERLQPGSPEIANQLAALYEAQGLLVEARAQYTIVADAYARAGQSQKSLEVLRRIADLDPENVEIRRRLAEGYARENFQTDAAEAFIKVGDLLLARGQHENALGPYLLALNIAPFDHAALAGMLLAHIALGTPQEAAEMLERAVAEQPDDTELLSMLARAHTESGDVAAAERSTAALIHRDKTNYPRFVDVARLYLKENNPDAAVRIMGSIVQQMLTGREEEPLIEILSDVLVRHPEHINALRLLVHIRRWQRDEDRLRVALECLAEAAKRAQIVDEERNAVAQLARLVPDNQYYFDRLHELGDAPVEALYANESIFETSGQDVPVFENFSSTSAQTDTTHTVADAPTGEFAEFEWNTVETPVEQPAEQPAIETQQPTADPAASFADLNSDWGNLDTSPTPTDTLQAEPQPSTNFQEIDFGIVTEEPAPGTVAEQPAQAAPDQKREALLLQELESVDFYLTQGYADIAQETLAMLERQFGAHPAIDERRAQLATAASTAAESVTETASSSTTSTSASTEATAEPEMTVEFSGYDLFELGEETEQAEAVTPAPPSAPAKEAKAAPPRPAAKKAESVIHPELKDVFDEFRQAVEEEPSGSDDDYETHYNLGLAYNEMELLDEAVEEFQIAAGLVAPDDGTPRYLQCCNLIANSFMKKGMPRLAAIWLKKGMEAPGHTEDEYQALRFELGMAYEQMGELDRAIETFTEVYGINVSYRGVSAKLSELKRLKDQGSDVRS